MKKIVWLLVIILCTGVQAIAQCSLCTKTAQQLGEGPAKGLNNGILMLAATPLVIIGIMVFRHWKNNREA